MPIDELLLAMLDSTRVPADDRPRARPCSIRDAVARVYRSECAYVTYRLVDAPLEAPQPRLRKHDHARARCRVLVADIDTPTHEPWSLDLLQHAQLVLAEEPIFATAAWYVTPRGLRVLQPLDQWIPAAQYDAIHRAWTRDIARVDRLFADVASEAHDWTHLYRPACCYRRDGKRHLVQHYGALGRSHAEATRLASADPWLAARRLDCAPIPAPEPAVDGRPVDGTWRRQGPRAPLAADLVEHLAISAGRAIRERVRARWHQCYLALAGALLDAGCPADRLEHAISLAHAQDPGWEHLAEQRRAAARSTIDAARAGRPYTALATLRRDYPEVARALTISRAVRRVYERLDLERRAAAVETRPLSELPALLRDPTSPLHVIVAPPGAGKTNAVLSVQRDQRWALSVPTHALAEQCLAHDPATVERLYSPPSLRDANGNIVCRKSMVAKALSSARISVRQHLCVRCEHQSTCPAATGREGAINPTLVVAPHALIKQSRTRAHKRAAIVLDEPPMPVTTRRYQLTELELIKSRLLSLDEQTRDYLSVAIEHLTQVVVDARWHNLPLNYLEKIGLSSFERAAIERAHDLRALVVETLQLAAPLFDAHSSARAAARRIDPQTIEIAYVDPLWVHATRKEREQRVVVLDASADAWLPIARVLWPEIDVTRLQADTRCEHTRVLLATLDATRAVTREEWLDLAQRALDLAIERGAREIGLITTLAAEQLTAELRLHSDARLHPGHYGAVRGLNRWSHCDALVTVLDPRPNLDATAAVVDYVGHISSARLDASALSEAAARAELEQAHGRLRTIHRDRPALSIHVGEIVPPGWANAEVVDLDRRATLEQSALSDLRSEIAARARAGAELPSAVRRLLRCRDPSERAVAMAEGVLLNGIEDL